MVCRCPEAFGNCFWSIVEPKEFEDFKTLTHCGLIAIRDVEINKETRSLIKGLDL